MAFRQLRISIFRIITLIVTLNNVVQIVAFLPDEYATIFRQLGKSHVEITECALNKAALEVLTDGDTMAMMCGKAVEERIQFCQVDGKVCAGFDQAVFRFARTNAALDSELYDPANHMDNEQFLTGNERILIEKQLAYSVIEESVDYEAARAIYGRVMHIIQDFYARSNWIELGNEEINQQLGRELEYFQTNTAPTDMDACSSCSRIEEDYFTYCDSYDPEDCERIWVDNNGCYYNWILGIGDCAPIYRCDESALLLRKGSANMKLTSGYFGEQSKPKDVKKCSRGGPDDSGAVHSPTGGINKDTNYIAYSPHHHLHQKAAQLAEDATFDLLRELRRSLGEDRFSRLIGIQPLERPTSDFAVVMDTTGSMHHEIKALQAEAKDLASKISADYYILSPFSDPQVGPLYVTRSTADFEQKVDELRPIMYGTGGQDAEEMVFTGILAALNVSKATTPIFTFTDEAPKDAHLFSKLAVLGMQNLFQFNFLITQLHHVDTRLYDELADLTGGMAIFAKDADIRTVTKSMMSQASSNDLLFSTRGNSRGSYKIKIDESVEQVVIEAASFGNNVSQFEFANIDDTVFVANNSFSTESFKRIVLSEPQPGEWQLKLAGSGRFFIRAFVKRKATAFKAQITLGTLEGHNVNSTQFKALLNRPIVGKDYAVTVEFPMASGNINLSRIVILSETGDPLETLWPMNRTEILANKFLFSRFHAPKHKFGILVEGLSFTQRAWPGLFKPVSLGVDDVSKPGSGYLHANDIGSFIFKVTNYDSMPLTVICHAFESSGLARINLLNGSFSIPAGENVLIEVTATVNDHLMAPKEISVFFIAAINELSFNYISKRVVLAPTAKTFNVLGL